MLIPPLHMLPTNPHSSLVIDQQILLLKLEIDIHPFKRSITKHRSLNDMPNLILMKRHSYPPPILNAILQTKRQELPIRQHTFFDHPLDLTLTTLAHYVPIQTQKVNILIVLNLLEELEDLLIMQQSQCLDHVAIRQFVGREDRALTVYGILMLTVVLEFLLLGVVAAHNDLLSLYKMRKVLEFCKLPQSVVNALAPFTFQQAKEMLMKGDKEGLRVVMDTRPRFKEEENLLMLAITDCKDEEIILYLIERFEDQLYFNRRNEKGDSPLMVAIFRQKKDVVRALIPLSEINACDFFRNTPFIAAAANGDIETLKLLNAHRKNNPLARNSDGHTALHRACYYGEIQTIDWLLQNTELKIGMLDKKGNNGLHLACMGASITASRYIVAKVQNPSHLFIPNHQGKMPLDLLKEILVKLGEWKEQTLHIKHLQASSFHLIQHKL